MFASLAIGAAALVSVDVACYDAINRGQQPGNRCSHEHAMMLEGELNRVWDSAVPVLRNIEPMWPDDGLPSYFEVVLEEQRAWIRFREAVCARVRYEWHKGSGQPYAYNSCMGNMALERIEFLKEISGLDEE